MSHTYTKFPSPWKGICLWMFFKNLPEIFLFQDILRHCRRRCFKVLCFSMYTENYRGQKDISFIPFIVSSQFEKVTL